MQNGPLVSVIVNCFNGEKYLEDCLNSIINQTYDNWEVIFWDNHSTDNSKKIFEKFDDKRFKYYLSPKHTFLYEARDLAIKVSNGDFIAFCDTDDYWSKEKLECLVPLFQDKNVGIVYSNQWILNNKTQKKKIYTNKVLPKGNISSNIVSRTSIAILTAVIRKTAYFNLKIGFNKNYQIIGDYDFFVRVSKKCLFDCVQKPLVTYRLHKDNFTKKNRDLEINELENWLQDIKTFLSKKEIASIRELILYKKITILILKKKSLSTIIHILKFPNNFKKAKLLLALLLPQSILEKKKEY